MPVEFLTPEYQARYGQFAGPVSAQQLARSFELSETDAIQVGRYRGAHNRLGFAVQLGTVRFLGTFITDLTTVPENVVDYVARQIGVDSRVFQRYVHADRRWAHALDIRHTYGFRPFSDPQSQWRFVRWLYTYIWLHPDGSRSIFQEATAYLIDHKILLPGVTTLAARVVQVRDRAQSHLWARLAALPTHGQRVALEDLLLTHPTWAPVGLEQLRHPVTRVTARGLIDACARVDRLRALGSSAWNVSTLPPRRLRALAGYAETSRPQALAQLIERRRQATLVAFAVVFTTSAQDDLVILFLQWLRDRAARAERRSEWLHAHRREALDRASLRLREVSAVLLDPTTPDGAVRARVFSKTSKTALRSAMRQTETATAAPFDRSVDRIRDFATVGRVLPRLFQVLSFQATPAGQSTLDAWRFVGEHGRPTDKAWTRAPTGGLTTPWRAVVMNSRGEVRPPQYTSWMLERLRDGIRDHDIYLHGSERFGDPRAQLLTGRAWSRARPQLLRSSRLGSTADSVLGPLAGALDRAYRETAAHWPDNPAVRMRPSPGGSRLVFHPRDRVTEPVSRRELGRRVGQLLPRPMLPDLLLEVNRWTGFADAFTPVGDTTSRVTDLTVSVCAVLLAQACNIGLAAVVDPARPALAQDRLYGIRQNFFRADTLAAANGVLVKYQGDLPLAHLWGDGDVVSTDGLRVAASGSTILRGAAQDDLAATRRDVSYYTLRNDQFMGLNAVVMPGTIRDAVHLLEGLLGSETAVGIREVMTDFTGRTDIIFGLFGLLGYQFSPRLRDVGQAPLYRMDNDAHYGPLDDLPRHLIRRELIIRHWEDMLRVAGSLRLGTVNATSLIRTLQHGRRPIALGQAIGELG
ncbi:MAG: Tn3 family transposase, partial [Clostridia bacterium]